MTGGIVSGAIRGALATGPMSLSFVLQGGERVPPEQIVKAAAEKLGVPGFARVWPLVHVGVGIAFGASANALGIPQRRAVRLGYGLALYALNYVLVAPQLGLYPNVGDDEGKRRRANAIGHAVFGSLV